MQGGGEMNGRESLSRDMQAGAAIDRSESSRIEKDAIRSLLDFQQRQDPTNDDEKPIKAPPTNAAKGKRQHKPNRKATLRDLISAQEKIPPPPKQIVPQILLMDMGKKRKHHRVSLGQFEDAVCDPLPCPPSPTIEPQQAPIVSNHSNIYCRPPFNASAIPPIVQGPVYHRQQLQRLNQQSHERRMQLEKNQRVVFALRESLFPSASNGNTEALKGDNTIDSNNGYHPNKNNGGLIHPSVQNGSSSTTYDGSNDTSR
eukprot:scaffold4841_cov132-Cylindrotheca_fusiformis.AAC.11